MKYRITELNEIFYGQYGIDLKIITLWFSIRKYQLESTLNRKMKIVLLSIAPMLIIWLGFFILPVAVTILYIILGIWNIVFGAIVFGDIDFDNGFNKVYSYNPTHIKEKIEIFKKSSKVSRRKIVAEMRDDGSYLEGNQLLRKKKMSNFIISEEE